MFYGGKYLWWNGSGTLTVGYSPTNYINELSVIEASVGGLVTVHHWECKVGLIASGGDVEDEEIQLEYLDIPNIITNIPNISYTRASISPPVAHFTYTPSSPHVGTYITFNGSSSYDPDGEIIYYLWAYRPANSSAWPTMMCNSTDQPVIQYKWDTAGNYEVILVVIDNNNLTDRMTTTIRIPFKPSIFNILPTNLEDRLLKRI